MRLHTALKGEGWQLTLVCALILRGYYPGWGARSRCIVAALRVIPCLAGTRLADLSGEGNPPALPEDSPSSTVPKILGLWELAGICSPSPRPSPSGRGRDTCQVCGEPKRLVAHGDGDAGLPPHEPSLQINGPLSLSLSPSKGERVPKAGEGAVQGFKARTRSGNSLPKGEAWGEGERGQKNGAHWYEP